jgi:polyhydroxybutyrate depolymerase
VRDIPRRRPVRERYRQRHGLDAPVGLTRHTLDIDGITRAYWKAAPPVRPALDAGPPLLIVLHGAGGQGPGTAALTGLDRRGPQAGFCTVFPDGVARVWNDARGATRLKRREGVDDVAFLQAIVRRLASERLARGDDVYLTGISNGSLMSEHIARHALLPVAGIGLVAGPGTQTSRAASPRPKRAASVIVFSGTADPLMPYAGGPIGFGRRRRSRRAGRGIAVAAEIVAADWAAANGIPGAPVVAAMPREPGDLAVTRLGWESAGCKPVALFRVEGGGHTWPGGGQYLPARIIGPRAQALDATGIMLEQFRSQETVIP